jgi:hypothetical protein
MRRSPPLAALALLLPTWAVAQTPNLSERHALRALVAPFSLTETGSAAEPIRFAGADYTAGEPVQATYSFNLYRLSYRYPALGGARSAAWIGFTAKIRDATIALEQGLRRDSIVLASHQLVSHQAESGRPAKRAIPARSEARNRVERLKFGPRAGSHR